MIFKKNKMLPVLLVLLVHTAVYAQGAPSFSPSTSSPADNATNVAVDANLTLQFDINILNDNLRTTTLELRKSSNDALVTSYTAIRSTLNRGFPSGRANISTNTLVVDPGANLIAGESYYILFPVTSVLSNVKSASSGARMAAITDKTVYNFTVASGAPTSVPIGPLGLLALLAGVLGTGFASLRRKS